MEEQSDYLEIISDWIRYLQHLSRTIEEFSAKNNALENVGIVMSKNQLLGMLNRGFVMSNIKKGTTYLELLKQCDELTGNWYEKVLQ